MNDDERDRRALWRGMLIAAPIAIVLWVLITLLIWWAIH